MQNLTGSVLVQRFRLDALESQEEVGDAYRGWDIKRNVAAAITVLHAALPHDPSILSFQRDSLTLQTLTHKNIAPFYGLYQDEQIAFLVERYVEGPRLKELLQERRGQAVAVQEAMIYLKALCNGLGYVHHFGLVHSNVQPAHIHIDPQGTVLLGGFGFARTTESALGPGALTGPPAYLPPEEIRREIVTPSTDIYGLGLVLFELLTGRHPFVSTPRPGQPAEPAEEVIRAQLLEPPPDPRRLNPAIPTAFGQVILTALAKEPKERFQNTQEMLEVACAVNGYTPEQVPDQLPPPGARPESAAEAGAVTQVSMPSIAPLPAAPQVEQTRLSGEMYTFQSATPQPDYAAAVEPGYPPGGLPSEHWGFAPGERAAPPQTLGKRAQRALPFALVAAAGLGVLLCAFLIGLAALPALRRGLAPAPASATATPENTATTAASPTAEAVQPTFTTVITTLPPTVTALPTTESPPTSVPLALPSATYTQAAPTAARTAFTVTIRNNLSYPIYAYRNDVLMGTDPIPPARFIFYRNIPAGTHRFKFCEDNQAQTCLQTREVEVNRDLTIALP